MSTAAKPVQPFWVFNHEGHLVSRHDTYADAFEHLAWVEGEKVHQRCYIQEQRTVANTPSVCNTLLVSAAERDGLNRLMEFIDYLSPKAQDAMWALDARIKANPVANPQ